MIPALRDKAVTPRYAVYWTPPADHPLWRAGCDWLGRDAERAQVDRPGEGPEALTRAPRRYGFHATLKAPMRLRGAADAHTFITAVATLALRHREFTMPPLRVDRLGDFVALRPTVDLLPAHPLRRLADDCVSSLDEWRAPASEGEVARHMPSGRPDPQRDARVQRWGYPHVFAHWRFHLTLSDSLTSEPERSALTRRATRHFSEALREPLNCGGLSVFVEAEPGADFSLLQRVPLAAVATLP